MQMRKLATGPRGTALLDQAKWLRQACSGCIGYIGRVKGPTQEIVSGPAQVIEEEKENENTLFKKERSRDKSCKN